MENFFHKWQKTNIQITTHLKNKMTKIKNKKNFHSNVFTTLGTIYDKQSLFLSIELGVNKVVR